MFESLSFFIQFLHFSIASAISFINCKLPISSFSYQSTLSSSFTMRFFIQYSTRYFHNYQHFYCPCIVSIIDNPKFVLDPKERKQKSIPVINILESISTLLSILFHLTATQLHDLSTLKLHPVCPLQIHVDLSVCVSTFYNLFLTLA